MVCLAGEFWELDADPIPLPLLGQIVLAQDVHVAPGGRGALRDGLQKRRPLGAVFDLGKLLAQIQLVQADD